MKIRWVPDGTRDFENGKRVHLPICWDPRFEEEVGSLGEERYKNTLKVDPKGPIRIPRVITNTESV